MIASCVNPLVNHVLPQLLIVFRVSMGIIYRLMENVLLASVIVFNAQMVNV